MTQKTFSRSLSEKLIEKGVRFDGECANIPGRCQCECGFNKDKGYPCGTYDDVCIHPKHYPLLTLEVALSKDFLSQITTAVLSASTDIAWSFTSGGYEGAEREIIKLLNKK